jgi:selenocysteine lyase/cysteine desulfurase
VVKPFDFLNVEQPLKPNAARFEDSAYNVGGFHGFGGSLELLLSIGIDAIEARVLELTDILAEGLTAQGWTLSSPRDRQDEKSGIVSATKDGVDTRELDRKLKEKGFVISAREGDIRVSPHGYNSLGDLERFLTALGDLT